jgi:hypothetical protein
VEDKWYQALFEISVLVICSCISLTGDVTVHDWLVLDHQRKPRYETLLTV